MFRNLKVLREAGIDPNDPIETWDQWLAQIEKVTAAGKKAVPDMSLTWWSIVDLYSALADDSEWGADFQNDKTLLNEAKYAQTLDFIAKLAPHSTGTSIWDQTSTDLFISDQLAFSLNGPWLNPALEEAKERSGLEYDWVLVPGPEAGQHADPQTGVIIDGSGNVPALKHASVTQYLGTLFGLPTVIGNDGVCAARGELEFGIGREIDSFAFVALGTGIGGAIVWNRQILQGRLNEPPEFGAVVVRPGVGQSRRGITGSVEDVAGARAVLDRYASLSGCDVTDFGVKELFERRSSGDANAIMVIDDMLEVAAQMLGTIVNLTGIQDCVLGGGISLAGPQLLDDLRARSKKYTCPIRQDRKIAN